MDEAMTTTQQMIEMEIEAAITGEADLYKRSNMLLVVIAQGTQALKQRFVDLAFQTITSKGESGSYALSGDQRSNLLGQLARFVD